MASSGNGNNTDAELCTVTIPRSAFTTDRLLTLVIGLSSPLQVTVNTPKKASSLKLELHNGTVLTQRNTILRTLCTFPSPLDCTPYNFMGGYTTDNASTTTSKAGLAGINSWMSYASTLSSHHEGLEKILSDLDGYLKDENSSFLLNSGGVTIADLDVYFSILSVRADTSQVSEPLGNVLGRYVHASRWFDVVQHRAASYMAKVVAARSSSDHHPWASSQVAVPDLIDVAAVRAAPPVFLYGHEGGLERMCSPAASAAPPAPSPAGGAAPQKGRKGQDGASAAPAPAGGGGLTDEQKKAAADKRAKKAAEKAAKKAKAAKPAAAAPANDGGPDISALDVRVGHIVKAWIHETADELYCEEVDLGPDAGGGIRNIASGLRPFYKLDEMQNRKVLVLCNLKARNLVGFPSHGMVLCASNDDHTKVEFVVPPPEAKVGERVVFEGYGGKDPEPENRVAKKKIFEKLAPDLVTDKEGMVKWKGARAMTSAGQCRAVNGMPNAHVS